MTFQPISRRTALRGMGVSIALPFLEAMLPSTASVSAQTAARSLPRRLVFIYFPNGAMMRNWKPTGEGRQFQLGRTLAPLERFKSNMLAFANLADANARG